MRAFKVVSLLSLVLLTAGVAPSTTKSSYRLRYTVALNEGSRAEIALSSGMMLLPGGVRAAEPVSLRTAAPRNSILFDSASRDAFVLKVRHSEAGTAQAVVFRYPKELRTDGDRATALFFDVTCDLTLANGRRVSRQSRFAVPLTASGAPARCLRVQQTRNGIALAMTADCTSE